ncbi:MAG: VWA domain-containing protein [Flavobacteriales bacterium]|nr:VWA domain-containing protein [Flavobacteriales bacterium]
MIEKIEIYASIRVFILIFCCQHLFAQEGGLHVSTTDVDLGRMDSVASARVSLVLTNQSSKKIFILRADASPDLKVKANSKTLQPGDTTSLMILIVPQDKGPFRYSVGLYHSGNLEPERITVSGTIDHLLHVENPMLACYSFNGSARTEPKRMALIPPPDTIEYTPSVVSQPKEEPIEETKTVIQPPEPIQHVTEPAESAVLPESHYKPINLIFLADVSGSMKDSLKLGLMKTAMTRAVEVCRPGDKISLVTYADDARILLEGLPGDKKDTVVRMIQKLHAGGGTAGSEGIQLAYEVAARSFITNGNNVIILATDGAFNLDKKTEELFEGSEDAIYMSVAGIGKPGKLSKKVLKKIAGRTRGRLVWVRSAKEAGKAFLAELKNGSKR